MKVLVTGASAGIGEKIVTRFAKEGHHVIAAARRTEPLKQLQAQFPDQILPLSLDIRNRQQVEDGLKNLPDSWKDIDVLVNNAGLARGLELSQDADLNDWDEVIDTNNKGLLYVTRLVLPLMLERQQGHIINMGSIAGSWPYKGGNVYGASKAFVRQFSLNLRTDLHGTPIRVTNIEPGLVSDTEFSEVRFKGDKAKAQEVYQGTQALKPEDIAESVFWVATQPPHVNINTLEIMPVCQTYAGLTVNRI